MFKQEDLDAYREKLLKVKKNIDLGKTPVFNELSCAKTNLLESVPYNVLNGIFIIVGTIILNRFNINELMSIAIVLTINNFCGALSNFIFVTIKHRLRICLCKRLKIEPNESFIAAMESLEYQSVG